jgi:Sugar-transfer associated ATP-grasp
VNRIRHYLSRLKSLDVRNFFAVSAAVAEESGRPRLIILIDMAYCSVVYQAGYLDYQEFEFWSLTRKERRTWITSGNANSIVLKYNQRAFRNRFADKLTFNPLFDPYLGRSWLNVRESTATELEHFITTHGTVMAKQVDGMGGAGMSKHRADEIHDFEQFRMALLDQRQYLVESFITQHPAMASLSPASVNSLRMITFFDGTSVHVMEAVLRMGNGAEVDNYARGGMYTVLDEKTGIARYGAFDKYANTFMTHPVTGTPIVGFQVPLYPQVLELLDTIARVVPEIQYVGWDVAIGEHGPIIIEGNYNTGVFQMKPSLTGSKTGLLPRFRQVIDF